MVALLATCAALISHGHYGQRYTGKKAVWSRDSQHGCQDNTEVRKEMASATSIQKRTVRPPLPQSPDVVPATVRLLCPGFRNVSVSL